MGARIPRAVPDAPAYAASPAEMDDFVELIARVGPLVARHGAVRIDPPPDWRHPPLRMSRNSRFFVKSQTLPEAPFVHTAPPDPHPPRHRNPQRRRRRVLTPADEDDDDDDDDAPAAHHRHQAEAAHTHLPPHHRSHNPPAPGPDPAHTPPPPTTTSTTTTTTAPQPRFPAAVHGLPRVPRKDTVLLPHSAAPPPPPPRAHAHSSAPPSADRAAVGVASHPIPSNPQVPLQPHQPVLAPVPTPAQHHPAVAAPPHTPQQPLTPATRGPPTSTAPPASVPAKQPAHTVAHVLPTNIPAPPSQSPVATTPPHPAPTPPRTFSQQQRAFLLRHHGMLLGSPAAHFAASRAAAAVAQTSSAVPAAALPPVRQPSPQRPPYLASTPIRPTTATGTALPVSLASYGSPDVLRSNGRPDNTAPTTITAATAATAAIAHTSPAKEDTSPPAYKRGSLNSILNHGPMLSYRHASVPVSAPVPLLAAPTSALQQPTQPMPNSHLHNTGINLPQVAATPPAHPPGPFPMEIVSASAPSMPSMTQNLSVLMGMSLPPARNGAPHDLPQTTPPLTGHAQAPAPPTSSVRTNPGVVGGPAPSLPNALATAAVAQTNLAQASAEQAASQTGLHEVTQRNAPNGVQRVAESPRPAEAPTSGQVLNGACLPNGANANATGREKCEPVESGAAGNPTGGKESIVVKALTSGDTATGSLPSGNPNGTDERNGANTNAAAAASAVAPASSDVVLIRHDAPVKTKEERRASRRSVKEEPNAKSDSLAEDSAGEKQRPSKRRKKPSRDHVSQRNWGQDETGRLTEYPTFQDSINPISLRSYEVKAMDFTERMRKSLVEDTRVNGDVLPIIGANGDNDWMRNPDVLEGFFWEILHKGVNGKSLTVNYGVDVEAEGAYKGESYVEWYGMDETGRMVKKEKRSMSRDKKTAVKEEPTDATSSVKTDNVVIDGEKSTSNTGRSSSQRSRKRKRKTESASAEFSGPQCHVGNLNNQGLLRHMPRMPGVNHSMFYVGHLFTRFCWHTEDAFLNSVSYLHRGSADKIWYAIPPKFAEKFEQYAAEEIFSDDLAKDQAAAQRSLMSKTTIFDPRELKSRGIECYRIQHKPGSFVLTAPRAYHAGFNCGFNIAEAVNFANPGWFPVGREASRCARRGSYTLIVPYEYLLFHEAKSLRDAHPAKAKAVDLPERVRSNARILSKELESVIEQGEQRMREYAETKNCRIAMLNEVDGLVKNNQLGPEFGPGAGMVCSICRHACHFYAEICGSCPDNREARCVSHFGRKFSSRCTKAGHRSILVRRHDPILLSDILTRLEEMGGIEASPEVLLKRYRGFLRPWETPLRSCGLRLKLNLKLAASRAPPVVKLKEKRRRPAKRSGEEQRKRVLDEDSDFEHVKKKRRSEVGRKLESARKIESSLGKRKSDSARRASKKRKREPEVIKVPNQAMQTQVETQSVQDIIPIVKKNKGQVISILDSPGAHDDDYVDVVGKL